VVPVASAPTTPIPATDPAELALSTGAGAGVGAVGAADVLPGQAGLDAPGSGVSFSQRSVAGASGVASILAGDMTDTASPVGAPAGSGPGVLPVLSHQVAGPAGAQPEQGLATVAGRGDAAAAAAAVDGVALPGQSAPDATGAGVSLPGRFVDAATAGGSGLPGQAASAGAGAGDAATAAVAAGGLTGQGDSDLTGVRTAAVPSAGQPLAATAATATGVASGLLQQDMDVAGPAGGVPAAPGTAAGDAAAAAAALAAGGGGAGAGQEGSGSAGGGFGSQGGPVDAASALPAVSHALSAADNLSGAAPGPGAVGGFATPVQPLATPVIPPATGQAAPPLSAAVHHQVFTAVSPLLRGRDGSYSVELALHPSDLGAVRVIVDVRHGEISIQMHAADPAARDALRGGLSELRQQLVDQGLRTGSMDVGSGGANGQQPQTPGPRTHTTQTAMGGPGSSDQLVATAGAAPSTTLDLRM
jgi:hypothetical protein